MIREYRNRIRGSGYEINVTESAKLIYVFYFGISKPDSRIRIRKNGTGSARLIYVLGLPK